ncbi:antA/AntB antirepressor family protein, partial [Tenacibaculum finnmarkense]|uniref:antA/AntB antirepressor family protein n=1 Tax=Tenacibaculum finnmarkense TaxID=2781243 RepID=UPI001EFB2809
MNTLINITKNNGNSVVNARELHQFLEVGKDFSTWIKDRINKYEFVENEDFEVFPNIGENPNSGRPSKDYAISLDMAKELSMVERNEKGKQARRYFIAMEKIAKNIQPQQIESNSQLKIDFKKENDTRKHNEKMIRLDLLSAIRNNLVRGDIKAIA